MAGSPLIFRLLLALHIAGIITMAGTTLIDFITFRTFCNMMNGRDDRTLGLLPIMSRFGMWVRTGAAIIILTGAALLGLSRDLLDQAWFKVKILMVIGLVLNGMLVGNQLGGKFRSLVTEKDRWFSPEILRLRAGLGRFYLIQLILFLIIILLSTIGPARRR